MKKDEDELLMAERIGQILEENRQLKQRIHDEEDKTRREFKTRWVNNSLICLAILVVAIVLASLGGIPIYKSLTTPVVATHCEVEFRMGRCGSLYTLWGIVPWHEDLRYGRYNSLLEALDAADDLGCRIGNQLDTEVNQP